MARNTIRNEELFVAAEGDSQVLLVTFGCPSASLSEFFTNARTWILDPAAGVAAERLRMADVCFAAVDDGLRMSQTVAYCGCAGGVLDAALDDDAKRYLRADPRSHYRQIPILAPDANARLQACRR